MNRSGLKHVDNMNRKEKLTHIRYLKDRYGLPEAMKFWISNGRGISRSAFDNA